MNRKPIALITSTLLAASLSFPLYAGDMKKDVSAEEQADRTAGQVVDDLGIAARLKLALAEDDLTNAMDIDIEVDRDQVQLNGFVDSDAARERAEQIAMNTDGVHSVANNLELQDGDRTTGEYLDDKVLTTKVKAALADDKTVESLTIDVETNRGTVSLGGHVDTDAERDAAEKAAQRVAGVVNVINNIEVRS